MRRSDGTTRTAPANTGVAVFSIPAADVRGQAAASPGTPPTKRGCQNTSCLDWVSLTFPVSWDVADVQAFLDGPQEREWAATEHGGNGYRQGVARGHIRLFHDGSPTMGPFVQMRGQGVRQFEAEQGFQGEDDWRAWIGKAVDAGASFSRLDFAFDDRSGLLTMARVRAAIEAGDVVSRWEKADPSGAVSLSPGAARLGDVAHFGKITSEMTAVIYDKALEQLLPPGTQWVRCELRARKKRAQGMARLFAADGMGAVARVLYGYLDFKQRGADTNRSRWKTADWWQAFIGVAAKLRLTVAPVVKTLSTLWVWVERQVIPSLAVLLLASGGDPQPLLAAIVRGQGRLKQRHRVMLAAAGVGVP